MKIILRLVLVTALLAAGFAAGFPAGRSAGFDTGSEWALLQAKIVAQEAGLSMPVAYEDGQFLVIMKQPRHLYQRAWRLADLQEQDMASWDQGAYGQALPVRLVGNALPDR